MSMVDVSKKPVVAREAEAEGKIRLSAKTLRNIRQGRIKKGNPFLVAEVAGMNAAKQTAFLIPHCHQIALEVVQIMFDFSEDTVVARCRVMTHARTGVEMEALVGVSTALQTLWDMVKYLEKDPDGQYPGTAITDIRVIKKQKAG